MIATLLTGCRIAGPGSGGGLGGGGGTGPFAISAVVTGLSSGSTGFALKDNGTDTLNVTANGTFSFTTKIASGSPYLVTISTQPSSPAQICSVAGGSGTTTANTPVKVTCSIGTGNVISGQVTGLLGSGLVLQDNATDNTPVTANGGFSFPTTIPTGSKYNVTVSAQPSNPTQTCTVGNGSGTAQSNVGTVVVTCSSGTLSLGGSVSGLSGTGLTLGNSDGDTVKISANGSFQFPILLVSGQSYNVTILTQPTGPTQICAIAFNMGTATTNVSSVQVTCPAVFHSVGGQVVGLYVPVGQTSNMVLQNNGGDNLPIIGNGAFTFVTQIANASAYDISIFVQPNSQSQGCTTWNWSGVALANVTDITIDCGHNDWTWMNGPNTSNQDEQVSTPPIDHTKQDSDAPGGSKYSSSWTDPKTGNLWLFTGSSHQIKHPNVGAFFGEMWEYGLTQSYFGGYSNYWTQVFAAPPATSPIPRWGAVTWVDATGNFWLFGGQDGADEFLNDLWTFNPSSLAWTYVSGGILQPTNGVYGTLGQAAGGNIPGGRWGAAARTDSSGTLWLFGGYGFADATSANTGLLNDLWKYSGGQWTWVSGASTLNPNGVYGSLGQAAAGNVPGGRQAPVAWIDNAGKFWMFGGFNLSPTGQPNAFNDLWEFNGTQWAWMSGANTVNQTGTYGAQGIAAASNVPGARWSPAAWSDSNGNFWMFGGFGYDATGNGTLDDMWEYKAGQWIWAKGPSSVSQTGAYGVAPDPFVYPHVTSYPGSRWGATYWSAPNGFWMFGGEGFDSVSGGGDQLLSDLWRYLPYP